MSIVINFRLRTKKGLPKTKPHYIYCRLRVNGVPVRSDLATHVSCLPHEWDSKAQRIRGYSDHVREQNIKLDKFKNDLDSIYNELRRYEKPISAEIIKQIYLKKLDPTPSTLLVYFNLYVENEQKDRIKDSTLRTWQSRYNVLQEYIEKGLKRKDVDLLEVTPKWLMNYQKYLVKQKQNCLNHAARAVESIMSVLDYAVVEEVLPYNSTVSLELPRDERKKIKYLNKEQLKKLSSCPYYCERLQKVVDCFLVQCYTGMAYNELFYFNPSEHLEDRNGITYIIIYRGKSTELCRIPLLPQAREILEKYNYILPVITNQKMNDFIKEAAKVAGLKKWEEITTHVGRKTCGCYLLNAGVRIEVVSKILGHKSVKTTETFYAELFTESISDDLRKNGLI
ncbi:site-specific integrase [Runella zeae]|uniref:site-specific integrase n=1 Tax=Runella zeae TaxID=94255 RepID=UPI00235752CF|nr:site-specific integrase [Runella zeae]